MAMRTNVVPALVLLVLTGGCSDNAPLKTEYRGSQANVSVTQQTEVTPGDWPNWRGPLGDGISRETSWAAEWPEGGPKTVWRKNVGIGFSSVSVADGRLCTMGHNGEDDKGSETVYCFDAATGEPLWKHTYEGILVDNLHEGGPGATPTFDGDYVYTLGREGQLYCLAVADGKPLWSKMLQDELEVKLPEWGFTCSPLVLGDMLVVDAGRTVALNKQTGKWIWRTEKSRSGYGSPCAFPSDQGLLVAVLNNDCLLVVRAIDGTGVAQEKWETKYATNSTTPIVVGEQIFISTGYNKGCALLQLDGNGLEYVYDNRKMRNHFNNSVLWEGHLYGIDGNSSSSRTCKLVCMSWETGQVRWEQRGFGCGSLLVADGKLIVLSDDGRLVTAEATPEQFRQIDSAQVLHGKCWTVPVLSHGRIYCRNAVGDLVCLDVRG